MEMVKSRGRADSDPEKFNEEEQLVAELSLLGIRYLSREKPLRPAKVRPADEFLADLVEQPSARVRAAVIAVLLSHPEYADAIPASLERLGPTERITLQSFYLAARLLQQDHALRLRPFLGGQWRWLPDLHPVSEAWGLPSEGTPGERLASLALEHRRRAQKVVNWMGTYRACCPAAFASMGIGASMEPVTRDTLEIFLRNLGARSPGQASLYLMGGCALSAGRGSDRA